MIEQMKKKKDYDAHPEKGTMAFPHTYFGNIGRAGYLLGELKISDFFTLIEKDEKKGINTISTGRRIY